MVQSYSGVWSNPKILQVLLAQRKQWGSSCFSRPVRTTLNDIDVIQSKHRGSLSYLWLAHAHVKVGIGSWIRIQLWIGSHERIRAKEPFADRENHWRLLYFRNNGQDFTIEISVAHPVVCVGAQAFPFNMQTENYSLHLKKRFLKDCTH